MSSTSGSLIDGDAFRGMSGIVDTPLFTAATILETDKDPIAGTYQQQQGGSFCQLIATFWFDY
jgi:hypothetical protein